MRRHRLGTTHLRRLLRASLFGLVLGALLATPAIAQERESVRETQIREILLKCDGATPAQLWQLSDALIEMGAPARRPLMKAISEASVPGRLCLLRALVGLDSTTFAAAELLKIATNEELDLSDRLIALELIGVSEEPDAEEGVLELLFALDPKVRLSAARALWRLETPRKSKAKQVFRDFLKAQDPDLRAEGALALAEIGDGRQPGVRKELRVLATEPGLRGKLANAYIKRLMLEDAISRMQAKAERGTARAGSGRWEHLDEMHRILREYYDIQSQVPDKRLREAAAHGMLEIPEDPNTSFLTPEEHTRWEEDMDPSYGGIGALIDPESNDFRILRPFFGGPAWKNEIKAGDQIVGVNGKNIAGLDSAEVIREIKGPPGTPVTLTIYRAGWTKSKDIKVIRAKIVLPTVSHRMLPGRIGFMIISNFGDDTGTQFVEQLKELESVEGGMAGLIIDLRWNPGGSLRTVKECLTPFLKEREPIATVRGRAIPRIERHFAGRPDRERNYPISVLINSRSASGAELMSGVLQHYSKSSERALALDPYVDAIVLGKPSYGKGTVQYKLELKSWPGEKFTDSARRNGWWNPGEPLTRDKNGNHRFDPGDEWIDRPTRNGRWDDGEAWEDLNGNGKWDEGEKFEDRNKDGVWNPAETFEDKNGNKVYDYGAAMRVTVARYYLPSGKNFTRERVETPDGFVYKGGVIPDIEIEPEPMKASSRAESLELQQTEILKDYVRARWDKHKDTFRKLAHFDGRDPSAYPDFDALYESLNTRLTKQELRKVLRVRVRRAVANELGGEIHGDLSDDPGLRRAVWEVLRRMNADLSTISEYAKLKANGGGPTKDAAKSTPK